MRYLFRLLQILVRSCRMGAAACFALALTVLVANHAPADEWQPMVTTDDGIRIYQKETSHDDLIEFRGIGNVEVPLPLVATVIFDTARRGEWVKGLAESRILRWVDKDEYIEYDHIDMPIFFSDRDFVSKIDIRFDRARKELVFHYQPSNDPSAPQSGYIRGEMLSMTFRLSPVEEGRSTRIVADVLCDPKGWIPSFLVNLFLRDWPKSTFRSLRKEVLKPDIRVDPRFAALEPWTAGAQDLTASPREKGSK